MTSNYKILDHTADIALELSGNTYEELFLAGYEGWKNSVIEASVSSREAEERKLELSENTIEELLVSFLQELSFLFESKKIFAVEVNEIQIEKRDEKFFLKSDLYFGNIIADDIIKNEIKAVTFHQLNVKKVNDVFRTIIVFDI